MKQRNDKSSKEFRQRRYLKDDSEFLARCSVTWFRFWSRIRAYYVGTPNHYFSLSALSPGRVRGTTVRADIDSLCRGARRVTREKDGCVTMRKRKRASDEKLVSHSHKWRRESRRDVLAFSPTPASRASRLPATAHSSFPVSSGDEGGGGRRQVGAYTDGRAAPRVPRGEDWITRNWASWPTAIHASVALQRRLVKERASFPSPLPLPLRGVPRVRVSRARQLASSPPRGIIDDRPRHVGGVISSYRLQNLVK